MSPISVVAIIVNYKSAKLTLRALEALDVERKNPELDLRVVVVENDSGDAQVLARGIEERFSELAMLALSPKNGGFGAGNNFGLRYAHDAGLRPRYVHFVNPDTEVRPGAVLELVRFLEAHPKAGIAGGAFEHEDGTPWRIGFRFPSWLSELEGGAHLGLVSRILRNYIIARDMGEREERIDWPSGASMMFRRTVLESVGGFDEEFFLYFEEIDLCLRAHDAGWECWYVPQSTVMHVRGQSTGVTSLDQKPKRLPGYWFESRRRYFVKHHGARYAALADLALLAGSAVGMAKDVVRGTPLTPYFMRDLIRHSVILRRNRQPISPSREYLLPALSGGLT